MNATDKILNLRKSDKRFEKVGTSKNKTDMVKLNDMSSKLAINEEKHNNEKLKKMNE